MPSLPLPPENLNLVDAFWDTLYIIDVYFRAQLLKKKINSIVSKLLNIFINIMAVSHNVMHGTVGILHMIHVESPYLKGGRPFYSSLVTRCKLTRCYSLLIANLLVISQTLLVTFDNLLVATLSTRYSLQTYQLYQTYSFQIFPQD